MKKQIKILIVTTVKVGYDGLTNHILSYVENMNKTDMKIDLVSARGIDEKIYAKIKTVGFHNIYRLEYRDNNQKKYFNDLRVLIRKNKYDIMHVHGNSATLAVDLFAGMLGGCKIRIAHSHNTSCEHKIFNMILKPLFNLCYTHGFACSKEAGKWLFGNKSFVVIPNGIDVEKYKYNFQIRDKYRKLLDLDKNTIALGNVAAFVAKKNHKFIVEVFYELNKISNGYKMFLFGINGDSLLAVKEQIKRLKLENKIFIMGTKDNIQNYLQAMDIMLLPSLYEGFPISVIEWQASGLQCILSDTITKDINILRENIYLPINSGTKVWVDKIRKLNIEGKNREDKNIERIFSEKGFDIKSNAERLRKIYIKYYRRDDFV